MRKILFIILFCSLLSCKSTPIKHDKRIAYFTYNIQYIEEREKIEKNERLAEFYLKRSVVFRQLGDEESARKDKEKAEKILAGKKVEKDAYPVSSQGKKLNLPLVTDEENKKDTGADYRQYKKRKKDNEEWVKRRKEGASYSTQGKGYK